MRLWLLLHLLVPASSFAAPSGGPFHAGRSVDHGIDIVRLSDASGDVEVSIVPSLGNRAYQLNVHGKNLFYFPMDLATFKAQGGQPFNGNPFLAPWGNRIAGGGFWANGKRYLFNTDLNNLSLHAGIAIHGMLAASPFWEVSDIGFDKTSAHVTSRLAFWRYPDLLANWPFAQEYEMTYRLSAQGLEVATAIKNMSAEPMPVVIGYHPYFNIPNVPRSEWSIHVPARQHVEADANLVATGEFTKSQLSDEVSLRDHVFDDGFTDLIRDAAGRATLSIKARGERIDVVYGPRYQVALVFVPPGQNFVCFEPMAAITNGINLAHDGKYSDLQMLAPNDTWRESFWIRFQGE